MDDIEMIPADPNNPEEGIIKAQQIVLGKGIVYTREDLLRIPDDTSDQAFDDGHEKVL
jgi:hypothetical protein